MLPHALHLNCDHIVASIVEADAMSASTPFTPPNTLWLAPSNIMVAMMKRGGA